MQLGAASGLRCRWRAYWKLPASLSTEAPSTTQAPLPGETQANVELIASVVLLLTSLAAQSRRPPPPSPETGVYPQI